MGIYRKLKRNVRAFGTGGLLLTWRELISREPAVVAVHSPHVPEHPLWLRLHTTDISTYVQMFVNREYALNLARSPRVIVDAGANIGFSANFFAQCYPSARILALEPSADNYALLVRNTQHLPNVVPLHRALWGSRTRLSLYDPGPGRAGLQTDGFQTMEMTTPEGATASPTVEAVDLDTLMQEYDIPYLDILKIDVEGAEKDVFQQGGAWLQRVGVIQIELHDRFRPGCSRAFYNHTNHFEHETCRGENIFLVRDAYWAG